MVTMITRSTRSFTTFLGVLTLIYCSVGIGVFTYNREMLQALPTAESVVPAAQISTLAVMLGCVIAVVLWLLSRKETISDSSISEINMI